MWLPKTLTVRIVSALCTGLAPTLTTPLRAAAVTQAIDREALVSRHNPHVDRVHPLAPLTVGNGHFAFTADVTGLQTFREAYVKGIPLSTQSDWGWHTFPNPRGYQLRDTYEPFASGDRMVDYPTRQSSLAGEWLRANPHRLGLGQIGFQFRRADGLVAQVEDIAAVDQTLDLWRGRLTSRFTVDGVPVEVVTACHPVRDLIAVQVHSPLLRTGRLRVWVQFGYGSTSWGPVPEDLRAPAAHTTRMTPAGAGRTVFARTLDATHYTTTLTHPPDSRLAEVEPHLYALEPAPVTTTDADDPAYAFTVEFSAGTTPPVAAGSVPATLTASAAAWRDYWQSGAALDLSGSTDPRADELERRVVLSQYLTAVQCAGDLPPQETGLTYNSWYGKAHLEMHWWHGVHFALWHHLDLLERSLPWYQQILPQARAIARQQGYDGARWPKMVGPDGDQGPSSIAPLLLWQQPHPIYFAELVWRQKPTAKTLATYRDIVLESAAFMASFARLNPETGCYDLGPPLIPAQESYDARVTKNPPFELAYWRWGLRTAQAWRERLGLDRDPAWDQVLAHLAPYPTYEDAYATAEGRWNMVDHPSVLGAYGMLPGTGIDQTRMRRTLDRIVQEQDWEHTWGWDYPLIAMTATRLGEPALALDALLLDRPKNTYLNNGHNWQTADRLRIYLPGNGGLLAAVAMMAGGWDGAPDRPAPGFPVDGTWHVRAEGFGRMP